MKRMKNNIFMVVGIFAFLIVEVIIVFFVFKPFNLESVPTNGEESNTAGSEKNTNNTGPALPEIPKLSVPTTTDMPPELEGQQDAGKHPFLDEEQEKMLEDLGIDPGTIPTEFTPEMQECFIEKLGEQRLQEIIGGATPNPIDLFKAKSCLDI